MSHHPSSHLSVYQKEVYVAGMTLFNSLVQSVKSISDNRQQLLSGRKNYLHANFFYSIHGRFNVNREW